MFIIVALFPVLDLSVLSAIRTFQVVKIPCCRFYVQNRLIARKAQETAVQHLPIEFLVSQPCQRGKGVEERGLK